MPKAHLLRKMNSNALFLGIDTSNYTTSLSLCRNGEVIKNIRRLLPVKSGECGLRQSDAVFLHTKALPELADELFDGEYRKESLTAVGVSTRPRDVEGSYMPCFLAGVSFASAVAGSHNIPLYEFSHQAGHVESAIYSSSAPEVFADKFISFHVSGGTTEALLVTPVGSRLKIEKVGGTSDTSAGQIIDRAGVYSGLAFPCGKKLDELSLLADKALPKSLSIKDTYFSFSGLQNKYERYISSGESIENCSLFLFSSIAEALAKCTANLRMSLGETLPVLFAGGVMSNTVIRKRLSEISGAYFASRELSSDNACGTALLCQKKFAEEENE